MSNDLNQCMFIGRLGKDPEIKYTPSGSAIANFSIACGKSWKDKQSGDKQEKTEWINIVAFNRLAEIIGEYLKKGSQVYISGEFRTRKWQDKSGNDRYTTEIVASEMQMLGGREQSDASRQAAGAAQGSNGQQTAMKPMSSSSQPGDDFEEDDLIPF